MIRALIVKELRENVVLVALAALGIAYALASLSGWSVNGSGPPQVNYAVPFIETDFFAVLAVIGGTLAALMGLKQSAWEELRGTYHYLLYRPIARSRVIAVKLVVGLALIQSTAAALILLHGLWAATPGKHGSPFLWSMTEDAWRMWLAIPVVYLSAFLSGLRPAAWYGTRLAPLAVGAGLMCLLGGQPWMGVAALGSALASAALAACVLQVAAERDY